MPKRDEFPQGADNTALGRDARLAKLLNSQRERELQVVLKRFLPLERERNMDTFEFYKPEEWEVLFQNLGDIIRTLLSKALFGDDSELKTKCQEVLVLLDNKDKSQAKRYSSLINKLSNFFSKNKIYSGGLP